MLLKPYDDVIWLSHGDVDLTLWAQGIAMAGGYDVKVCEPDVSPVQVQGPQSLALLQKLVATPLDNLGFYKNMPNVVAGVDAIVSRTGWSGGLGLEVYPLYGHGDASVECDPGSWQRVRHHGDWSEHQPGVGKRCDGYGLLHQL